MNAREAKRIELGHFLSLLGHKPHHQKGLDVWYLSPFRAEKTPSFKINTQKNLWYDFGLGHGGTIIELTGLLYGEENLVSTLDLIADIVGERVAAPMVEPARQTISSVVPEIDRVEALSHPALLDYLASRAIPLSLAQRYCSQIHYRVAGKQYFAIGFANQSGGWELRNARFKGCIGSKDITYLKQPEHTPERRLMVFEGFLDYLSMLALTEKEQSSHDVVVLNSVANVTKLEHIISVGYKAVHAFLDNDRAGDDALAVIRDMSGDAVVIDERGRYRGVEDVNAYLQERSVDVNSLGH